MIWNSWNNFFAMGGYALYVWGSVMMVAIGVVSESLSVWLRFRANRSFAMTEDIASDALHAEQTGERR